MLRFSCHRAVAQWRWHGTEAVHEGRRPGRKVYSYLPHALHICFPGKHRFMVPNGRHVHHGNERGPRDGPVSCRLGHRHQAAPGPERAVPRRPLPRGPLYTMLKFQLILPTCSLCTWNVDSHTCQCVGHGSRVPGDAEQARSQ